MKFLDTLLFMLTYDMLIYRNILGNVKDEDELYYPPGGNLCCKTKNKQKNNNHNIIIHTGQIRAKEKNK